MTNIFPYSHLITYTLRGSSSEGLDGFVEM